MKHHVSLIVAIVCMFVVGTYASCSGIQKAANLAPYLSAVESFVGSPPDSAFLAETPKLYVLENCDPPKPAKLSIRHVEYRKWIGNRKCTRTLVEHPDTLAAVSQPAQGTLGVVRRSLRAEPSVVEVVWPGMHIVTAELSERLWPADSRYLRAELQTVLLYKAGDRFDRHVDRCEETGQEGVLIVDLGLRGTDEAAPYHPEEAEFFIELGPSGKKNHDDDDVLAGAAVQAVGNWSAAAVGSWIGFPMHRAHGVYPVRVSRVVAVFTLVDPRLERIPLCAEYEGSCLGEYGSCRPGAPCIVT